MQKILTFIIFLFISFSSNAQFNFTTGYSYGAIQSGVTNDIIQQINTNNSSLTEYKAMKDLKGFHGFHVGAQTRFEFVSLFVGWNSKVQLNEFKGNIEASGQELYRELYYRVASTSLGLEIFPINEVSFGASLDLNRLRIRSEDSEITKRYAIMKDSGFGSHFFVSLNVDGSDLLDIAFQPYVQIPWTKFDISGLEERLETGVPTTNFEEGYMNYGIRLIFRNGRQND